MHRRVETESVHDPFRRCRPQLNSAVRPRAGVMAPTTRSRGALQLQGSNAEHRAGSDNGRQARRPSPSPPPSGAGPQGATVQGSGERTPYPAGVQTLPGGPTVWRRRRRRNTNESPTGCRTRSEGAAMIRPRGLPPSQGNIRKKKGQTPSIKRARNPPVLSMPTTCDKIET